MTPRHAFSLLLSHGLATCVALCLTLLAAGPVGSQEVIRLPDMGSPSDGMLSVRTEAILGRQVYANLVASGAIITDPELQEYIQDVGMRLVANAQIKDGQSFHFFMVDNPIINAFALPGGYIGVHTGLLLATENESELAGVLAHEISHVTQRHISRAVYANQRASTMSLAMMLGAILVGVAAGADADVIAGAASIGQGMALEQQISFTRANEYEADRLAVAVLADAGFDPMALPDFFETMGSKTSSFARQAPQFMMTHPLSADRMAETRARARGYGEVDAPDSSGYELALARARLLTSSRPELALEYFEKDQELRGDVDSLEHRYGRALALARTGDYAEAERMLRELVDEYEEVIPLHSALAEAQLLQDKQDEALATFSHAMELFPRNVPLTVRYSEALMRYNEPKRAHVVLLDLLNQVPPTLEQVRLIAMAANAAGDTADSYYYMAEYQAMSGNLRLAIDQLLLALNSPGLDSVQRARFEARLQQFQEYLPRQGGR